MKKREMNGLFRQWAASVFLLGMAASCAWSAEPAEVFRFETAKLNDPLPIRFHVRNTGTNLLEMRSVTSSCDCVTVTNWTPYVEAGATGLVEILFVPDKAGEVDYRVRVQTSSSDRPEIEFAVQGMVASADRMRTDRDWSLYVGAEAAAQMAQDPGGTLWVDVRSAEAYGRARIPGSLQIPLHAVKTKGFLKDRRVVLVDEGHGSFRLEEECRKLREMGFSNLSLWHGGMNAWRQLGGKWEGSGDPDADRVAPIALRDIARATDWLVVDAGGGSTHRFDGCQAIPFDAPKKEGFVSALNAAIAAQPQVATVLIATETGDGYADIAETAGKIDALVYYLEGGWKAWEAHRRMMEAIPHARTVVSRNAAAEADGARGRSGGCGGCPK